MGSYPDPSLLDGMDRCWKCEDVPGSSMAEAHTRVYSSAHWTHHTAPQPCLTLAGNTLSSMAFTFGPGNQQHTAARVYDE